MLGGLAPFRILIFFELAHIGEFSEGGFGAYYEVDSFMPVDEREERGECFDYSPEQLPEKAEGKYPSGLFNELYPNFRILSCAKLTISPDCKIPNVN